MDHKLLYSLIYMEINFFAIMLLVLIRVKTLGISKMVAQRNFSIVLDTMVVFFASDTFWVLMEAGVIPFSRVGIIVSKDVYFLAIVLMCFAWFVYFEYLQDSPFVRNKKSIFASSCLVILQLILIIVNHFTRILYYVDENDNYLRGPLFLSLYLLSYTYILFTCVRAFFSAFRQEYSSEKRKLLRLASFQIFPAIGGIAQFLVPKLPVVCWVLSLATLQLYLDWVGELVSIDPLTRLNNRKQLVHNYEQWLKQNDDRVPIYLLMIDANNFKVINDTYGHVEGDAALLRIADALRSSVKSLKYRSTIARYGGDEFVVLAKAEKDEDIFAFMDKIRETVVELNKAAETEYELTVCIGMAKTDSIVDLPFKEFSEKADAELYKEKKRIGAGR